MLLIQNNTLHLIDTLWLGGAQQVLKGLFENNTGQEKLFLLALRRTDEMISISHKNIFIADNLQKWNFWKPLKEALSLIDKHDIKTLHCHLPKSQLTGWIIKKFYKPQIKLIFHEQGDIADPLPNNWPCYFVGKKDINAVVCCSNFIKNILQNKTRISLNKTSVIYNFNNFIINPHSFTNNDETSDSDIVIGYAGRITKRKGWQDLISACRSLKNEYSHLSFELHIAGAGPEEKKLDKEITKNRPLFKIKKHNFVKNMGDFYQKLDILCVPSHREPLGMVHLEAMAFGVPVIASNVPGMDELLKNNVNAILIEPHDIEGLKNAILSLFNNMEKYLKLRNNGIITANTYDFKYFENALQEIYNTLEV